MKNTKEVEKPDLGILQDVDVEIMVRLGRKDLPIKQVLQLGEGSIIELDRMAGEPVEILANGKLIAYGEVIVIDECFGVRVTDILEKGEKNESD